MRKGNQTENLGGCYFAPPIVEALGKSEKAGEILRKLGKP
jgi:hypothetical protein